MTAMAGLTPKHFLWRMEGSVAVVQLDRPERKNPAHVRILCRVCATPSARWPTLTMFDVVVFPAQWRQFLFRAATCTTSSGR